MHVLIAIDHAINDAMRLDKEVDVDCRVNVTEEIFVDGHEQLDVPMVIDWTPDSAELPVHLVEVGLPKQELLDHKGGERLVLLQVHVGRKLRLEFLWQLFYTHRAHTTQCLHCFVLYVSLNS